MIPVFRPRLPSTDSLIPLLAEVELNQIYSNFGPLVRRLEEHLAEFFRVGSRNITTLCNATLALEGAVKVITTQIDWVSPSWTFTATNLALQNSGVKFNFEDIGLDWRLRELDTSKGIMDVCPFGDSVDFTRYLQHPGPILIDAAGSYPSLENVGEQLLKESKNIGIVVSFHPTKILPGIEGGVFISNNVDWVTKVRAWSNFGFAENSRMTQKAGTNAKMNEFQAAMILASIQDFRDRKIYWTELHKKAMLLSETLQLQCQPAMQRGKLSTYWIIQSEESIINEIAQNSESFGFQTRRWWNFGCHKMPAYKSFNTLLPITEDIASRTIGLPFHLCLRDEDFSVIERGIKTILG